MIIRPILLQYSHFLRITDYNVCLKLNYSDGVVYHVGYSFMLLKFICTVTIKICSHIYLTVQQSHAAVADKPARRC